MTDLAHLLLASGQTAPLGSPFGRPPEGLLSAVRGPRGRSRVPKDRSASLTGSFPRPGGQGSDSAPTGAGGRVGRRQLAALQRSLSERDLDVLQRLAEHRFLTSIQLQRFVFTGHASEITAARTARRTLARLTRDLLIRDLPRRQGGPLAGSTPAVWQLTTAGVRLLGDERGSSYRVSVPTTRFLAHCLAVADVHLAVRDVDAAATVQIEGAASRPYAGSSGEPLAVRPDLRVRISGQDEHGTYEDEWFIEVDLGTEALPTLLRKCAHYEQYRATGIEQAESGSFPLVLWLMNRPERVDALQRRVRLSPQLTPALYRYATLDDSAIRNVLGGGAA